MKKVLKAKEKEIYNLENVNLNQLENIRRIKEDSKKSKVEKTNLEKQLKKSEKKKFNSDKASLNNNNSDLPSNTQSLLIPQSFSSASACPLDSSWSASGGLEKLAVEAETLSSYFNASESEISASSWLSPPSELQTDPTISPTRLPISILPSTTISTTRSPHTPLGTPPPSASTMQPLPTSLPSQSTAPGSAPPQWTGTPPT